MMMAYRGVGSLRVEVWVSAPEPAVGVFTTAGTCQGGLGQDRALSRRRRQVANGNQD